jgi:tRNA U34 2-thiouridine synthase MnmA/TrmU
LVDESAKQKKELLGLGLVSGGLDSLTACLLLQLQGIKVIGLNFKSPFCLCDKVLSHSECGLNLFYDKLNIKFYTKVKGDDYLEVVRHPKFGYGKNLNPCIDCRIYILKKAKEFQEEIGADFIFTGEVLGQRPKSQNRKALDIVEKESELEGNLLRPLSARLLKPTILEENGLIDRSKLLDIQGRSRKKQLELAREHGLLQNYFACGGCLLTDQSFANRMKDLLDYNENVTMKDVNILKYGRHFRYKNAKIIIGRDHGENTVLLQIKDPKDYVMEARDVVGPITVIQGEINDKVLDFAGKLTLRYADFEGTVGFVKYSYENNQEDREIIIKEEEKESLKSYIL